MVMMRLRGYGINPDEYHTYGLWRRPQGRVLLRGLLNADLKPAYDRALAFARKVNGAAG